MRSMNKLHNRVLILIKVKSLLVSSYFMVKRNCLRNIKCSYGPSSIQTWKSSQRLSETLNQVKTTILSLFERKR